MMHPDMVMDVFIALGCDGDTIYLKGERTSIRDLFEREMNPEGSRITYWGRCGYIIENGTVRGMMNDRIKGAWK
jgi:hypothetical protein